MLQHECGNCTDTANENKKNENAGCEKKSTEMQRIVRVCIRRVAFVLCADSAEEIRFHFDTPIFLVISL